MTSHGEIADRWADQVGTPDPRFIRRRDANVIPSGRQIWSYGSHFVLAELIGDRAKGRAFFLVNGDRYSHSTSQHQALTRDAIKRTGLPSILIPFTALSEAGIDRASIRPVEVLDDRWEVVTRRAATRDDAPSWAYPVDDHYEWEDRTHHLGESLFTATYKSYGGKREGYRAIYHRRAYFLSAFDGQDIGLYFLAQLPRGARPATVAEAFTALRPPAVLDADAAGVHVTRQGDVFAIPVPLTTRQLTAMGVAKRGAQLSVLGVGHTATEVIVTRDRTTYARGILRHRPQGWGRRPEHRNQRMEDGRTWHALMRNTVPDGRSWSVTGNVD